MTIWYIDEDRGDLFTYTKELKKITEDKIEIKAVVPRANQIKMAELILTDTHIVSVVIDHRLGDTKDGVTYNGLDLARAIRKLNDKLPIYILTNHPEDLTSDEWEIEYVFAKDDFKDKRQTVLKRINRHLNIYSEILETREKRFAELLQKSISETLTNDELKELELLDYSRSASLIEEEAVETSKLKEKLDEQQKILDTIKAKLEEGDDNGSRAFLP